MVPTNSNIKSKKCGQTISSNCVVYDGPAIEGLCKGASLTEAIYQTVQNSSGCCAGDFPTGHQSCYTGDWVDFSSSIPSSGVGGGFTWTLGSFGSAFPTLTGAENTPQYKWTTNGDLKVRGSMTLTITTGPGAITNTFLSIPLATIPVGCFPTNATASQTALVAIDAFVTGQAINIVTRGFLTINPTTGVLYFNFSFATVIPTSFSVGIYMGGTTFNLA